MSATTIPEAMVSAAARVICQQHARLCGVNEADAWRAMHDDFKAEARPILAAALAALRADPYEPEPRHSLHDAIVRAVSRAEQDGGGTPISYDSPMAQRYVKHIVALIDRERPALADIDVEALVGELEKRGWTQYEDQNVWPMNDTRLVASQARVLIAPEDGR